MCVIGTKVGQGHPDDCVCNDSVRHVNLPNMIVNSYASRRDNRKLGQTTFTDSHKVKVIYMCMDEDANNTSECTSLHGGFTAVVITFRITVYHSRKSR